MEEIIETPFLKKNARVKISPVMWNDTEKNYRCYTDISGESIGILATPINLNNKVYFSSEKLTTIKIPQTKRIIKVFTFPKNGCIYTYIRERGTRLDNGKTFLIELYTDS